MPRKNENSSMAAYLNGNQPVAHPAQQKIIFTPGHHRGRNGAPRAPKMPEKPIAPFVRYSQKHWDTVKTNNPDMRMWEISKFIARMWREAAEEERETFIQAHDHEKKQYHELVNRYYASPQYQSYMQAKQRWDSAEVRDDDEMTFSMEPIDDVATDDNSCSNRAVHAMRFHRNTYYMLELLSDHNVNNHMKIMRADQIQALDYHRTSLTGSIAEKKEKIESAKREHEAKKRRWAENSDDLEKEWKRLAEMTPVEYFKEYTKKQEDLKKQREAEEENRRKEEEEKARIKKLEEEERARVAAEEAAKNPQTTASASPKQETETPKTVENGVNVTELEEMETNSPAPAQKEPTSVKTEVPSQAPQVAQNPLAAMNQLVGNVEKLAEPSQPEQAQAIDVKAEPEGEKVAEATSEQVFVKPAEASSAPVVKEEFPSAPDIKTEEASSTEAMETDQAPATESSATAPTES